MKRRFLDRFNMRLTYLLSLQCTRNCPLIVVVLHWIVKFRHMWHNWCFQYCISIFALRHKISHGFAVLYVSSLPGKGYCYAAASPTNNSLLFLCPWSRLC